MWREKNIYFTEHDIYFTKLMFILKNINLELKSALRTKYIFYRFLLYPFLFYMLFRYLDGGVWYILNFSLSLDLEIDHFILSGFVSFGYMWNTFSELPFSQGFIGLSFILCNLTDVHNIPFWLLSKVIFPKTIYFYPIALSHGILTIGKQ